MVWAWRPRSGRPSDTAEIILGLVDPHPIAENVHQQRLDTWQQWREPAESMT
ncbi:hypothetical protein [Amycolatopsis sp. cmx-11-51]|uniref:hypothetical protein n=1 Tax=unclassified Amycolatopsis TaxID=2618356 RepID=UPI0039E41840